MSVQIVDEFPWEGEYTPLALSNLITKGSKTLFHTRELYEVRDQSGQIILAAGVALWSIVRKPELWVLLTKAYGKNLRNSVTLTREALALPAERFPGLICEVHKTNRKELNFVRRMGWRANDVRSIRPAGDDYIQFELS